MEPEGPLPHRREPTTCPYPESDQSSPCPPSHFLKIHFNIILPSAPRSSKWTPSLRFPHQNPVRISPFPICATCPTHLIFLDLRTYCLAVRRSEGPGPLEYGRLFVPIGCLLSPLPFTSRTSFSASSRRLKLGLPFLLLPTSLLPNIFLIALPFSILTTYPVHSNLSLLIFAILSSSLYSSLNSSLVLIPHIPCSTNGPYTLNIFLSLHPFISYPSQS